MNTGELQQQLFKALKSKTGPQVSLADEIAGLLGISSDSVYRRIRGEISLGLDELYTICNHYHVSLDQLMNVQTGGFQFEGKFLDTKTFRFDAYLKSIMHQLAYINSFKGSEYYYLCKESPMFHHYYFREFSAFKYHAWMCTLLFFPEFRNKKFKLEDYPAELFEIGQKILGIYEQIDSVEIWNIESMNSTLRQIDYYQDGGLFESDEDILKVYEAIEKAMEHIEAQAELGYKFKLGDPDKKPLGRFRMYFNEVVLGDNQMLAVLDGTKIAYVPHSAANYMSTRDVIFCEHLYEYLQNLMRRSTLISEVSEKERARFFRIMRGKIENRKEALRV
ncbi:MAG: helix-turn-helix domain-containing protein [Chitinophagaceae bacterium]